MAEGYLNRCLAIEGTENSLKGKSGIAEVAAATLCRLNGIMKQMKDWRDDRAKLRSNIWRLKLALRVAGRETEDTFRSEPILEHQRTEIKRLESANRGLKRELFDIKAAFLDGGSLIGQEIEWKSNVKLTEVRRDYLYEVERLNNEIRYLKSRLNETDDGHEHDSEMEHLKCQLKHFVMIDHTMEIIFTDIVNKVAETIANLSEELVNVNERFHRSQIRNDDLYLEIDKLKAMLRVRSDNVPEYQKRVTELEDLSKRLRIELQRIKDACRGDPWTLAANPEGNVKIVERLACDLRRKLQNDREAFLAAGDPNFLKYMQKIVELRVILRQAHAELRRFNGDHLQSSNSERTIEYNRWLSQVSVLDSTFREINVEIDKLKGEHVKKNCKLGGRDGHRYLSKIEELESIVEKARTTLIGLNRRVGGKWSFEWKDIEILESFVDDACREMKELEAIVASNDSSIVFKRIEQLEEWIVRLKTRLDDRNDRFDVLGKKLLDTECLLGQRVKELNETREKFVSIAEENRKLRDKATRIEERTMELEREQNGVKKELELLQRVKDEASATRKKLLGLRTDKEGLLQEIGKVRDTLQKRNEEIKSVLAEKDAAEKTANAKIMDLMRNLQAAFKENEKLQAKQTENERSNDKQISFGNADRFKDDRKRVRERSKSLDVEVQRLKSNLTSSIENLEIAHREIADLKDKLDRLSSEKSKLEASVEQLESKKETLVYNLGAEKAISEGTMKELTQLKSNYNAIESLTMDLKKEKDQLFAELANLRFDKDLLEKSVEHVRDKCSTLEDEIEGYKRECDSLKMENERLKTIDENLNEELNRMRGEMKDSGDRVTRLEMENSRLQRDLNELTLKNADLEARLQIHLSERNELEKRVVVLDEENVWLRDELNEIRTANDSSVLELNRLKEEYDKTRSECTELRQTLETTKKSNEELKEADQSLRKKLNRVESEFRIMENRLRVLEAMNSAIKKDKDALEREYENLLQSSIAKIEKDISIMCGESAFHQETDRPGKRVDEKKKTTETKEELKRLTLQNESLKFEVLNLRNQCLDCRKELALAKEESQKQKLEMADEKSSRFQTDSSNDKLEVINLYYEQITSQQKSSLPADENALIRNDRSSICSYAESEEDIGRKMEKLLEVMNKIKVENIALKIEVNSLRSNLVADLTNEQKWRNEIQDAADEIEALKVELTNVRDEKESLRIRLDDVRGKYDRLEWEKIALKEELYSLRKINSELKQRVDDLRCDYQKLKEKSTGFEDCIMRAMKKIQKYTMRADIRSSSDEELKLLLKKYISNEEILIKVKEKMSVEKT